MAERARVVIGADGARSRVATAAGAGRYHHKPMLAVAYYSYWSGFPASGACWAVRPRRAAGALATNDGLTMLLAAWPTAEFQAMKKTSSATTSPPCSRLSVTASTVPGARNASPAAGPPTISQSYGPGWALAGDAGYLKDPVTAQGITDAFHDAELCTQAADEALTGSRTWTEAMASHQRRRDARVLATVRFTGLARAVFCELRRRGGSLLVPGALHWATNGLGVLAAAVWHWGAP